MPIVPLSPGQHLNADAHAPGGGRFRIEKPLSAGGFAITYLAHDQQFDDRCVIKELAIDQLMVRSGTEMVPLPGREADVAVWVQKVQKEEEERQHKVLEERETQEQEHKVYMEYICV